MAEFKVLRRHLGDKDYDEGDIREAEAADVAHLVANDVLKPLVGKKAEPHPNKAETGQKNKDAG